VSYAALAKKAPVGSTVRSRSAAAPASGELRISGAHDAGEQEAERTADAVIGIRSTHQWSLPALTLAPPSIQRQPKPTVTAVDPAQKRLDTFAIDAKDLSNPLITGQLRSMSNSDLVDYRNKVKDTDVKQYVDSLLTFSTPLQAGAGSDPLTGAMTMTIGNVNVVITPDVRGASVKTAETGATLNVNPPAVPGYSFDKDGVVSTFPGYAPTVTLQIVTSYEAGVTPQTTSGYGRGTTPQDLGNKATSLRFHEGSHGEDFLDFVRQHPFPVFAGKTGIKKGDFEKAKTAYTDAVSAWGKALNKVKVQGDCVGKTIDDFHKGEQGYKNICP